MKAAALDHRLWYTASNEDGASEIAALSPPGRRILSITASGSRTFDLLTADPAAIVSIDQNPAQTAIAELLAQGYRQLSYARFAVLIGLEPDRGTRCADFCLLAEALPQVSRAFWQANAAFLDRGLVYAGRWEGFLRTMHRLAGPSRRALAARLLAAPSLDAQYALWRDEWDNRGWRLLLRLLSIRWLWRHIAREPGIAFVAPDFDIPAYVAARFDHAARHILFRDSPFAWLMLSGGYPGHARPAYLSEACFGDIASRIDRVTFITGSLQDHVASAAADSYEAASLSDYSSYCDADVQCLLWRELARVVAPGGRVCERKFFNKSGTELPETLGFTRDRATEDRLTDSDRAFFYSFVVAERA